MNSRAKRWARIDDGGEDQGDGEDQGSGDLGDLLDDLPAGVPVAVLTVDERTPSPHSGGAVPVEADVTAGDMPIDSAPFAIAIVQAAPGGRGRGTRPVRYSTRVRLRRTRGRGGTHPRPAGGGEPEGRFHDGPTDAGRAGRAREWEWVGRTGGDRRGAHAARGAGVGDHGLGGGGRRHVPAAHFLRSPLRRPCPDGSRRGQRRRAGGGDVRRPLGAPAPQALAPASAPSEPTAGGPTAGGPATSLSAALSHRAPPRQPPAPTPSEARGAAEVAQQPPVLFEIAWEVCWQLGGIYTVLRTKAAAMLERWGDRYCLIGPYNPNTAAVEFEEQPTYGSIRDTPSSGCATPASPATSAAGSIAGRPRVILIDYRAMFRSLDHDKYLLWTDHHIATHNNDGEVNEVVAFGFAVAEFFRHFDAGGEGPAGAGPLPRVDGRRGGAADRPHAPPGGDASSPPTPRCWAATWPATTRTSTTTSRSSTPTREAGKYQIYSALRDRAGRRPRRHRLHHRQRGDRPRGRSSCSAARPT